MTQFRRTLPQSNHSRLNANCFQLRPVELVRAPRQLLVIDVGGDRHLARVNFQDACAGRVVWQREFNFAIQSARPQEGGVQDVDSIRRSDNLFPKFA